MKNFFIIFAYINNKTNQYIVVVKIELHRNFFHNKIIQ